MTASIPAANIIKPIESNLLNISAMRKKTLGEKEAYLAERKGSSVSVKDSSEKELKKETTANLKKASHYFPRIPFPWEVFPDELSESLKQLADSLAILQDHIPDVAMVTFASIIGRRVKIKAKSDHIEQLIFWLFDVRAAGAGKSPAKNKLTETLRAIQEKSDEDFEKEKEAWEKATDEEKKDSKEPTQPRGYFSTNYTSEGLRTALKNHPTGGFALFIDEGSALISGQNAYKSGGKGSDREELCTLFDGNSTRVVRAKETHSVPKSAVSISAGIQPEVLKRTFGGNNGLFLVDGTIMRCLFTYSPPVALDIDSEASWTDANKAVWNNLINKALDFQPEYDLTGKQVFDSITTLTFNEEARKYFYEWRNTINRLGKEEIKIDLVDGFIQKAVTYGVRFTGLLVLIKVLHEGTGIPFEIGIDDVKKGIKITEFYLGQTIDIIKMFIGDQEDKTPPVIVSKELNNLAVVLESLKDKTEKGMLSIGFIADEYNILFPARPLNSKKVGNLVSMAKLTKHGSLQDIHGRKRVSCIVWDKKTNLFIKSISRISLSLLSEENQIVAERDVERCEAFNLSHLSELGQNREVRDVDEILKSGSLAIQVPEITTIREIETCETSISNIKNSEPVFDEEDLVVLTTGGLE